MRTVQQRVSLREGLHQVKEDPRRSKSSFRGARNRRADAVAPAPTHTRRLLVYARGSGGRVVVLFAFEVRRRPSKSGPPIAHDANSYWPWTASLMEPFGALPNEVVDPNSLKDMVGPWGLEPQTSTVSIKICSRPRFAQTTAKFSGIRDDPAVRSI